MELIDDLTIEQAEQMTEAEQLKLTQGFEFILRRAKEIASYHETILDGRNHGETFNEERCHIEFRGDSICISWIWDEYGAYQYHEQHQDCIHIPLSAIFSRTEEERNKAAARAEVERIQRERKAREDEARARREEALARQREVEERATYQRLHQKYGNQ